MKNRLFCSRVRQARATKRRLGQVMLGAAVVLLWTAQAAVAGDAPQWMHALVNVPLPAHDEKTNAVLLYSEKNVTVVSADKIKTVMRQAYRILRPSGRDQGTIVVYLDPRRKVNSLHGWCIPAEGKDYEVKDKDALEASAPKIEGGELVRDLKAKILAYRLRIRGILWAMSTNWRNSPWSCRTSGHFRRTSPQEKVTFRCNFRLDGNTSPPGLTTLRLAPARRALERGNGSLAMSNRSKKKKTCHLWLGWRDKWWCRTFPPAVPLPGDLRIGRRWDSGIAT